MKKYKYFIFLVALSFIFYNCKHEIIKQEPSITTVTQSGSCSPDSVYFNKDVMPIIQANCAVSGCHGGGAAQDGVDLSSYDKIINTGGVKPFDANDSDLYEAITETNSDDIMPQPPYDPLSATEIALIKKWIDQGALNNSCQACDTSQASFSNDILPIITGYCTGCHGDNSPSAGIALTNHSNIADNASSGQLSDVINHNAGVVAMPYLAEKLDPCYIAKIDKWIAEGMQNN